MAKSKERILFGTDGIRGKANIYPMTCEVAMALGRAVTSYFQKRKGEYQPVIIIGKDTRLSCYMLEQAFSSGVCSQGGRAILTGPLPTPGVAFVVESMRADAGVMISASHNVFSDNGLKIFDSTGHKLPDEVEIELEEMIFNPAKILPPVDGDLGRAQRLDEVVGRYIVHAKSAFKSKQSLEGVRIFLDCAHGAAYKVAPMVFSELGAQVLVRGTSPNGRNINELSGAIYPEICAKSVLKYRADFGICLDGDGDRVVMIDHLGNIINGDKIIGLCSKFLRDIGDLGENEEVIGTVMSNIGLENYLQSLNLKLFRTKVGDRYIFERMLKSGSIFGGEPSGHIIFKNHSTTGDGIVSALKVIESVGYYGQSLHELAKQVELSPQIHKNLNVKSKPPLNSISTVVKAVEMAEEKLGKKGRVVLRYSGTELYLRLMVEGDELQHVKNISQGLEEVISKELN